MVLWWLVRCLGLRLSYDINDGIRKPAGCNKNPPTVARIGWGRADLRGFVGAPWYLLIAEAFPRLEGCGLFCEVALSIPLWLLGALMGWPVAALVYAINWPIAWTSERYVANTLEH